MADRVAYKHSHLSGYADDLAFVLHNLWEGIVKLITAFDLVNLATTLSLNMPKTVIVPLFTHDPQELQRRLAVLAPRMAEAAIAAAAKYLGLMVGPGAMEVCWHDAAATLRKRTKRIKSLALSFNMSLNYYNCYAASTCSHVLQYRPVDSHLRAAESACLASVTASPMNAMPRDCMANLGLMGIRPKVQPLDTTSLVSRC